MQAPGYLCAYCLGEFSGLAFAGCPGSRTFALEAGLESLGPLVAVDEHYSALEKRLGSQMGEDRSVRNSQVSAGYRVGICLPQPNQTKSKEKKDKRGKVMRMLFSSTEL